MSEDIGPAGADGYALIPAKDVDEERLIDFAAEVWPERSRERTLSSWWRRAEPSCAIAAVHRATGKMAGICCARPSRWTIAGRTVAAIAICEWYVAPGDAGKGIGKHLVRHFESPNLFLYTFLISEAAAANFRRLGWNGPYRAPLLVLPFPRLAKITSFLYSAANLEIRNHLVTSKLTQELAADLDDIEKVRSSLASDHMLRDAKEWSWKVALTNRTYRFCVLRRGGLPVGYVAVRRLPVGSVASAKFPTALIADLVAVEDDTQVLRALGARAADIAAELQCRIVVTTTTKKAHQHMLTTIGYLSPGFPLFGRLLRRRSPVFMWSPAGPGSKVVADRMQLTFADSDADLNL